MKNFLLFLPILFNSLTFSDNYNLQQALENDGYFFFQQGAALNIFNITPENRQHLLKMMENRPIDDAVDSEHFKEKIQIFHVCALKDSQDTHTFRIRTLNKFKLKKECKEECKEEKHLFKSVKKILKKMSTQALNLTGKQAIGIDFKFCVDTDKKRDGLFWHQDVWGLQADPKYVAFAVLDRSHDDSCKNRLQTVQELGLVDSELIKQYYSGNSDIVDDVPLIDSPDYKEEASANVTFLARNNDQTDSGYMIDQSKDIAGKKIVHRRSLREACPSQCAFSRTSVIARIKAINDISHIPKEFLGYYFNMDIAKQLCKNSFGKSETRVLDKQVDDPGYLKLVGIEMEEGPEKYLAIFNKEKNNVHYYIFEDGVDPLKENLSIFTPASILISLLRDGKGKVAGKREYKWNKSKKVFEKVA